MTVKRTNSNSSFTTKTSAEQQQSLKTAITLKRYLDLTLRGTRKSLAEQRKKGYPISPYTFDRPDLEKSLQQVLQTPDCGEEVSRPPNWVNEINSKVVKHSGEAPIFTEKFLPSNKGEQSYVGKVVKESFSRPLSGISTKSAPVIINGEMYYRQNKKHTYLQASRRPASAKEDRLTRAAKLRNKHRSQSMSGVPSDTTKDELKRLRDSKPRKQHLNKDLLPIPCHTNETSHSFIIGARYNCSHFMDSRSFSRLGLYVPRQNPLGSFLKSYKGEDAINDNTSESEAFVGHTSVRTGGSVGKPQGSSTRPLHVHNIKTSGPRHLKTALPAPHVRMVVKEAWLNSSDENRNTHLTGSINSENKDRFPKRGSLSRSPIPPHPSPKLVNPHSRRVSAGSNRTSSSNSKKSSGLTRRSWSPAFQARLQSQDVRPTTTSYVSRNIDKLKDLHLPRQGLSDSPTGELGTAKVPVAE